MKKLAILLLVLCLFVGCQRQSPAPEDPLDEPKVDKEEEVVKTIKDYYPFLKNTYLTYEGAGMEYAEREYYFDFIGNDRAQLRNRSTGTTMVQILEYQDGALKMLLSRGEVYNLADFTNAEFAEEKEILLMEPIEVGTSWELPDGRKRKITGIDVTIETPSGNYKGLEVTTEGNEDGKTKTYYVEGVGMVLSVFETEDHKVTTSLAEIEEETDVTYTLRCYYPNFEKEQLVYKDYDISFQTNDEIQGVYTENLQRSLNQSISPVFSKNVRIQSFSYNPKDDLVEVDLSNNFTTELNLGSGYESLVIQSIVNTVGYNFGVEKVVITLDGELYASGHYELGEGEYFEVDYNNVVPLQ